MANIFTKCNILFAVLPLKSIFLLPIHSKPAKAQTEAIPPEYLTTKKESSERSTA